VLKGRVLALEVLYGPPDDPVPGRSVFTDNTDMSRRCLILPT